MKKTIEDYSEKSIEVSLKVSKLIVNEIESHFSGKSEPDEELFSYQMKSKFSKTKDIIKQYDLDDIEGMLALSIMNQVMESIVEAMRKLNEFGNSFRNNG